MVLNLYHSDLWLRRCLSSPTDLENFFFNLRGYDFLYNFSLISDRNLSLNTKTLLFFIQASSINVPHVRPETPRQLTHTHDEDCSDEDEGCKAQAK